MAPRLKPAPADTVALATRAFQGRLIMGTVLVSFVFAVLALTERATWKLAVAGAAGAALVAVAAFGVWRIRRGASLLSLQLDLAFTTFVMATMVYVTGGIESPLVVGFAVIGFAGAYVFGDLPRMLPVVVVPFAALLIFAAGAIGGWLPRATPDILGLGAGFSHIPVYVWSKTIVILMFLVGGSFIGTILRAILSRVHQEADDARRQALEALATRNEDILSVANTIAHELKNPLASLQGLAQLAARAAPPGTKEHERLEVMLGEIGRMRTVLEEFRNFTRPLGELARRPTDLGRLVTEVCHLSEGLAQERGIDLAPPDAPPVVVSCDAQKIKQALVNLVQNGIEAGPRGSSVAVRIEAPAAEQVRVVVEDEGPGIPAEALSFRPGFTTKDHGSGIGLVVARSITEQHGGRLLLAARPAGGTTATLTLPR
jgi:two-component system, NtrC family, sensor histidine kinase HydH